MSRRPNPAPDRAAQNAQTLKALVKLEGNKVCADCKRNKHPRWASWNLGVFICIRCSGIHRGMGTHISRVKSVDLDAWTDEQLQSILKWGNTRANKYFEAKLAPGHVPSEAKIENFIRTKYDTKRWAMDGPMPDPATLDTDDDVPLNIVQEKAKIERSASQRAAQAGQRPLQPPQPASNQNVDLFGDFAAEAPVRPSTADLPPARVTPTPLARPKQESLLGLDFFGSSQGAGIGRPTSASSTPAPNTNPRGDLKNSILSLYASTPKPTSPPQQQQARQTSIGSMANAVPAQKQDSFSVLTDAFQGFQFSNKTTSPPVQQSSSTFSNLGFASSNNAKATPAAPQMTSPPITSPPPLSGGSFFDTAPSRPSAPKAPAPVSSPLSGLDFSFTQQATSPPPVSKPVVPASMDLFGDDGFSGFESAASPPEAAIPAKAKTPSNPPMSDFGSAFNLSSMPKPEPPKTTRPAVASQPSSGMFDPWGAGDNNAWGAPEPPKPAAPKVELGSVPSHITPNDISGSWGSPISSNTRQSAQPTVTADEDFGGWTSAPAQSGSKSVSKPSGGFAASDPFDNPWG